MKVDREQLNIFYYSGGVIVIAIAALLIYRTWFTGSGGLASSSDIQSVRGSIS
jgi:hypothetical protein